MENISNTKAPDGKPQRRSVFAILAGLMVIGFFLLCVGFGMSGFFCHDSMLFVFSLFFLPCTLLFVWLAYKQYCALFCCEPIAARAWHETWLGLGFFLLFGSVANILDDFPAILKDDEIFSKNVIGWTIVFVMLVCGLLFPVIGWLLRQQTIRRQKPFLPAGQKFLKIQSGSEYRFQKVIGVILMSVCVILFVAYIVSEDYPEIGEHYSYEQLPNSLQRRFPSEASDFSWRSGYRSTNYWEFTVSEEAFRRWISSDREWEYCDPITESVTIPYSIHRLRDDEERTCVTDGLVAGYVRDRKHGGKGELGGGHAVFDRLTNRAYYWTDPDW